MFIRSLKINHVVELQLSYGYNYLAQNLVPYFFDLKKIKFNKFIIKNKGSVRKLDYSAVNR